MRPLLLLCLVAFSVTSCKKPLKDDQEKIKDDLMITMRTEEGSGKLTLLVATSKQYPCSNYSINFDKEENGNKITTGFNYVQLSEFCLTSIGPAIAYIELGQLQPGTYSLVLKCNGKKDTVPLAVTDKKFTVEKASGKFFSFSNTELSK